MVSALLLAPAKEDRMKRLLPHLDSRMAPHLRFIVSLLTLSLILFGLLSTLGCWGCGGGCGESSGSCGSTSKTVNGATGQANAKSAPGLQARTLWEINREIWPHDVGLDSESCETVLAHLRRDNFFVAVRVPGPVAEGAPSPLVTESHYEGIVNIWRHSQPTGSVYEADIRQRPDMVAFAENNLPTDSGDQWLALSLAKEAPARLAT